MCNYIYIVLCSVINTIKSAASFEIRIIVKLERETSADTVRCREF